MVRDFRIHTVHENCASAVIFSEHDETRAVEVLDKLHGYLACSQVTPRTHLVENVHFDSVQRVGVVCSCCRGCCCCRVSVVELC